MNKTLLCTSLAWLMTGCQTSAHAADRAISASPLAFIASNVPFTSRANYVSLDTPYPPTRLILEELERRLGKKLVNRGESHVTVLTPPEYERLVSHSGGRLSMKGIDDVARAMDIQSARLEPVCIGEGRAVVNGSEEKTFYIVLNSPRLIEIRRAIVELAGGGVDPEHFYPHITLGFTKADLHEHQGVIKDAHSCVLDLQLGSH